MSFFQNNMKNIPLTLAALGSFGVFANPTSGWDEDYSYGNFSNSSWSLFDMPLFWGLVLLFGGALIFGEIRRKIKPHPFDDKESLGLGCMIPTVIMFVLGVLYFINEV